MSPSGHRHVCTHTHNTYTHTYVHTRVYIHAYTHITVRAQTYTYIHTHPNTHIYHNGAADVNVSVAVVGPQTNFARPFRQDGLRIEIY
jgi:hypothetical protein